MERLANGLRGHWGVESMRWLLDIEFKDDLSRYCSGHGGNGHPAPLRTGPRACEQIQRKHKNTQKISGME